MHKKIINVAGFQNSAEVCERCEDLPVSAMLNMGDGKLKIVPIVQDYWCMSNGAWVGFDYIVVDGKRHYFVAIEVDEDSDAVKEHNARMGGEKDASTL